MSEAAPEGGGSRPGGGGMSRMFAGVPVWGWVVVIGAAGGGLLWLKLRGSSGSTSTSTDTTAAGSVTDTTDQTSEYEQVTTQLTGIEGTQEALLAAVKDLQGADSDAPGSSGGKVKVPDIVGDRGEAARAKISGAGLKYKQDPETTPRGRSTEVTSQTPHAGTEVAKGAEVTAHVRVKGGAGSSGGGNSDTADSGGSSPASSAGKAAAKPASSGSSPAKPASGAPATKAPTKAPAKAPAKRAVRPPVRRR